MAKQMLEKLDDPRTADGPGKQSEITIPKDDSSDYEERSPGEVRLQHRCLSFRAMCACARVADGGGLRHRLLVSRTTKQERCLDEDIIRH